MDGIGEWLRRKREELGLTIDDISQRTKYRPEVIRKVEEGRPGVFPAEVYLNVFLRAYAAALGLDPDEVVKARKSEEERASEAIRNLRLRHPRKRTVSALKIGLIGVGVVAVVLVVVYLASNRNLGISGDLSPSSGSVTQGKPDTTEAESGEVVVEESSEPEQNLTQAPISEAIAENERALQDTGEESGLASPCGPNEACLEVIARGSFYLKIRCGADTLFKGYFYRGNRRTFCCDGDFVIVSMTNRYQASFVLDGEPYELPGTLGENVYDFTIPNRKADPH